MVSLILVLISSSLVLASSADTRYGNLLAEGESTVFLDDMTSPSLDGWHVWNDQENKSLNDGEWFLRSSGNQYEYAYYGSDPMHTLGNHLITNKTYLDLSLDWVIQIRYRIWSNISSQKFGLRFVPDETVVVNHTSGTHDPPEATPPIDFVTIDASTGQTGLFGDMVDGEVWVNHPMVFTVEKKGNEYTLDMQGMSNMTYTSNLDGTYSIALFIESTGPGPAHVLFDFVNVFRRTALELVDVTASNLHPVAGEPILLSATFKNTDAHANATWPTVNANVSFFRTIDENTDGLIAHYDFDQDSGTVLKDVSGNGFDGDITGAAWTEGLSGGALEFNGGGFVDLGNSPQMQLDHDFTVQTWVKFSGKESYYAIFSRDDAHNNVSDADGYLVFITEGTPRLSTYNNGTTTNCRSPSASWDDQWHMITAVGEGSDLYLYFDSWLIAHTPNALMPSECTMSTNIGRKVSGWGGYMNFEGLMDEMRIYSRPLTEQEVLNRYYTDLLGLDMDLEHIATNEAVLTGNGTKTVEIAYTFPSSNQTIVAVVESNGFTDTMIMDNGKALNLTVNPEPYYISIPDLTMDEDENVTYRDLDEVFFDDNTLTYTFSGHDIVSTSLDADNKLTVTGLPDLNGQDQVQITATDIWGAEVTGALTINVNPVNDPPVFTGLDDRYMEDPLTKELTIIIDLSSRIFDVDNVLDDIIVTSATDGVVIENKVATITIPVLTMSKTIEITASDLKSSTDHNFSINVNWTDLAPVISSLPELNVTQNVSYAFDLSGYISDREDDTLVLTTTSPYATILGQSIIINVTESVSVIGVPFRVTDTGANFAIGNLVVHVTQPNRPPTVTGSNITVNEGEEVILSLNIYDPDMHIESVTYAGAMASNRWITDHDDAGTHIVKVTVSDGEFTSVLELTITVLNVNRDPSVIVSHNIVDGGLVDFTGSSSSDPDRDTLTYGWDFGDGETSSVADPSHEYERSGTYTVNVIISDGMTNITKSIDVTVTVSEDPMMPSAARAAIYFVAALSVAAVITIILFFVLTEVGIYAILTMIILPIYSRLTKKKILNNETRKRILRFVHDNPGAHLFEIRHTLDLANGASAYHLDVLQKEGFVWSDKDGFNKRFYPTGLKKFRPKKHTESQRQILHVLSEHKDLTQKEIVMLSDLPQSTVSRNLKSLEDDSAVVSNLHKRNGDKPKIVYNIFDRKDEFNNCPYCGKEFQMKRRPKFCPFCSEKLD